MEKSLKLYTYDTNGVEVAFPNDTEQAIATSFTYNAARMGDAPSLNFTLMHTLCLDGSWSKDVHVEFNGERYYLRQTPTSVYDNTDSRYKHTVDMVSERIVLNDVYFFDVVSDMYESDKPISNSSNVVFFGDIYEFANRLRASLEYSQIDYDVVIDDGVTSEGQLMSFNNMFFSNVLQEIYNKYKLPYYFVGKTIHIGEYENEISEVFEYGSDKALMSVSKSNANFKVVNRCTGVGSSENIPYYYPNPTPYGVVEYLYNGVATNNIVVYDWGRFARCGVNKPLVYSEIDRYGTNVQNINLADLTNHGTVKITEILDENIYGWVGVYEFTIPDGKPCSLVGAIGNSFEGGFYKLELADEDDIVLWSGTLIPSEGIALAYGNFKIYATFGVGSDDIGAETTARNYGYLSLSVKEANSKIYSWTLDERVVSLGSIGIKNLGSAPAVGDTISFQCDERSRVAASPNLMPHVYRDTEYRDRFYNAQNQTYTDDDGDYYEFSNPYIAGWPKEHIVDFPDIKPTLEGVLNNSNRPINVFEAFEYDAEDNDELDENGNYKHPYFFAKLRRFDKFNLFEQSIEGGAMTVSMTSGACGACKWTIGVDESSKMNTVQVNDSGELERDANGNVVINAAPQDFQNDTRNNSVWIALKKEESTFGVIMPNRARNYFPKAGDTFTLLDISMPQEYIISAERRLEKAIIKYMAENNDEKFNFAIKLSRIHLEENHEILNTLNENSVVKVKYNNKEYRLHVSSYSYKMNDNEALPEVTIELSDTLTVNRGILQNTINTIKGDIVVSRQQSHDEIEQAVQKKADKSTTLAGYGITDAFTMSEARDEFMSTRSTEDITSIKNFAEGIKIGGMLVRYDESIDAFIFPANMLVEKGMSAYTTFDEARLISVFDGLPIDNDTIQWKETESGKILVAAGGSGGGIDKEQLQDYLDKEKYVTEDWVTNKEYALQSSLAAVDNRLKSVETFFATDDDDTLINKWDEIVTFLNAVEGDTLDNILSTKFDKTSFTKSNIKSTLGISDWALASSLEWSAINNRPTKLSQFTDDVVSGKYLAIDGTAADSSKLGGVAATYYSRWADHIVASSSYKHIGYGYSSDGWYTTGPAAVFGVSNYKAALQFRWTDSHFYAGYGYETDELSNWKQLAYISDTVDAAKKLSSNSKEVYYSSAKDAWVLEGNLVVSGGLATYTKLAGWEDYGIMEAIETDETTISKVGGVLHFIGEMGGLDKEDLEAYLSDNSYYNSTTLTKSVVKTKLGISDWALASTKPLYTWDDITSKPSYLFYSLNAIINPTDRSYRNVSGYAYSTDGGGTTGVWASFYSNNYIAQIQFNYSTATPYVRAYNYQTSSWSDWRQVAMRSTTLAGYGITNAYTKTEVQDNFLALTGGQLSGNLEVYKSTAYIWANSNGANSIGLRAGHDVGLRHRNSSNVEQWALAVANSGKGMWTRFPLAVNMSVDEPRSGYSLYVNGDSYTTGTFYLNGAPLTYNSSKNAWLLEGNLIVTGGVATYTKLSGFEDLDVMGGIVTDGTTIHVNDAGQLEVIGGGGGGSVSITGAASTIVSSNLTASRALISNSSGKVAVSAVTSTELGYLDGVTSAIQTQLNNKQAKLVSGTNIKTINNQSILGSGNITISGGSASYDEIVPSVNATSTTGYSVGAESYTYRYGYFNNIQARKAYAIRFYTAESSTATAYERMRIGANGQVTLTTLATESAFNEASLRFGDSTPTRIGAGSTGNLWLYGVKIYMRTNSTSTASGSVGATLDASGNMTVTGSVTENSDRKLKNVEYEGDGLALTDLKKIKVAKWHWKDKRDERLHIGGVADNLMDVIPEAVFESEDENGVKTSSIAYGKAGFAVASSLVAPVSRHEDKIAELEKSIEQMQKELNKLKKSA